MSAPLSQGNLGERGLDILVGRGPQATMPPEPAWTWSHRWGDTATEREHGFRERHSLGEGTRPKRGTQPQRGGMATERGHRLREASGAGRPAAALSS